MDETIFGLEPNADLPDGWLPMEAVAVIKCLDDQGDPRLLLIGTRTLNQWEAMGMLIAGADISRREMRSAFAEED